MKIGIDISQIAYRGAGVARFTEGLVKTICRYDKINKWTFVYYSLRLNLNQDLEEIIRKSGNRLIKLKVPQTFLSLVWNDLHRFSIEKIVGNLDWYITSDWIEPPTKELKKATIVHDLVYFRYPETVDKKIRAQQEKRLSLVKTESKLIIADSQQTKKDLQEFLKIPANKVEVIYPGVEIEKINKNDVRGTIKKFKIKRKFILTVGKIEPRKNIQKLIEAFDKIKNKDLELVVIGAPGWGTKLKPKKNVRLLGFVTDQELTHLYNSCLFFVYPSIWEGFGYPVVEAMKYGVPVATSNTSSLKEIAEGYALLFDPNKTSEIKKSLELLIDDKELRLELSKKGLKRSKNFTWENYYKNLIRVLRKH